MATSQAAVFVELKPSATVANSVNTCTDTDQASRFHTSSSEERHFTLSACSGLLTDTKMDSVIKSCFSEDLLV